MCDKVNVARWSVGLVGPEMKQHRAFDNKPVSMRRLVDAMQESFERKAAEHQLKILLSLPC